MSENQKLADKLIGYDEKIAELKKEVRDLEGSIYCLETDRSNTRKELGKLVGKQKRKAVIPTTERKKVVVVSLPPEKEVPEIDIVEVSY